MGEREIIERVRLCDDNGALIKSSIGWSRKPLHDCELRGNWMRKKRWNYWCITNEKRLFSVTMSNLDYASLAFAYFLDFETMRFIEQTVIVPLNSKKPMPAPVDGDISFSHKNMNLSFTRVGDRTSIHVYSPNFGGEPMAAHFTITHPNELESLNVVIPWSEKRYQFTSKQNCLPCIGEVKIGASSYSFNVDPTFANLDFGRGAWPYSSFWNWATFSGLVDGKTIGANLGGGWTDGTGMTENGILYDNTLIKIEDDMIFTYDRHNLMKPWHICNKGGDQIDLIFTPLYQREARTNFIVLKSRIYQMIGHFSGEVRSATGEMIKVDRIVGSAEEHFARW